MSRDRYVLRSTDTSSPGGPVQGLPVSRKTGEEEYNRCVVTYVIHELFTNRRVRVGYGPSSKSGPVPSCMLSSQPPGPDRPGKGEEEVSFGGLPRFPGP